MKTVEKLLMILHSLSAIKEFIVGRNPSSVEENVTKPFIITQPLEHTRVFILERNLTDVKSVANVFLYIRPLINIKKNPF